MSKNNLPQKAQITGLTQYKEEMLKHEVISRTYNPVMLTLKDYEQWFRANYECRYNIIKVDYEVAQTYFNEDGVEVTDYNQMVFEEIINDMNRAGAKDRGRKEVSDQDLTRIIKDRRLVPEYDPIIDYFNGLPKFEEADQGHIDDLARYVTIEGGEDEQARWKENFKKALVRTVKCALNPLYFNKHCLVLYSSTQSKGKTSFLRTLSPPTLSEYYYEEMIGTDKDSQIMLAKSFIILLDELANLSKMDINSLKAVLSKREVNVRIPYEKRPEIFARRCSFFGTTNRNDFLVDRENVRWLVFDVADIDMSYGNIFTGEYNFEIDKVWAEALYLYRSGFNPELSVTELSLNEDSNEMYTTNNSERDIIDELFIPASSEDKDKKGYYRGQPTQVYEKAIELLLSTGRDTVVKALEKNPRMFYQELGRMKGWKKMSVKLEDGRVVTGYHYLIRKEVDKNELF